MSVFLIWKIRGLLMQILFKYVFLMECKKLLQLGSTGQGSHARELRLFFRAEAAVYISDGEHSTQWMEKRVFLDWEQLYI